MTLARQGEVSKKPESEPALSSMRPARMSLAPQHPLDRIRVLQQTVGNQGVLGRLQAKLAISQPGDAYEQEADRVADAIMSNPKPGPAEAVPPVQGKASAAIQRKCAQCEEEDENFQVQRKESSAAQPAAVPLIVGQVLTSPGQPLDSTTRASLEPRFGFDFGGVRIHTDSRAAESAQAVNAKAYTVGPDIVFARGQYSPASASGRYLLAHELTHVIQQMLSPAGTLSVQRAPMEQPLFWWHMRGTAVLEAKRQLNLYHQREQVAGRPGFGKKWRPLTENDFVDDRMPPVLGIFQRQRGLKHQDSRLWQETLDALNEAPVPATPSPVGTTTPAAKQPAGAPSPPPSQSAATTTHPRILQSPTQLLAQFLLDEVQSLQRAGRPVADARMMLKPYFMGKMPTAVGASGGGGIKGPEPQAMKEGKMCHLSIGALYAAVNPGTILGGPGALLDLKIVNILIRAGGTLSNEQFTRLPEELLDALKDRPDILDAPKLQIYEIKPVGSTALAVSEALWYIEVLEELGTRAGVQNLKLTRGSPTNPGTSGIAPTGDGRWCVYTCPVPGAIVYQVVNQTENPANAWEQQEWRERGVSEMTAGVEVFTGLALIGAESLAVLSTVEYPALIEFLKGLLATGRAGAPAAPVLAP